eukprot:3089381-Pyramimonas_sp.AAC.1
MSTAFLVRDSKLQVLRRLAGHAQSGLQPFAGCAAAVPFNQALRCEFAGMRGETLRREAALLEASGQHAELADAAERVRQQMRAEEAANQALQRQLVAAQEAAGTAATLQGALVTEALVALSEARDLLLQGHLGRCTLFVEQDLRCSRKCGTSMRRAVTCITATLVCGSVVSKVLKCT